MTDPTSLSRNGATPPRADGGTVEISFIVPLFNHLRHTQAMLRSLFASLPSGLVYEVILVDDFSTDGTRAWLATLNHPRIKTLLNPENLGYAASNNAGASLACGELLGLLNNDLLLEAGWLEPMIHVLRHPGLNAGLVGNVQYRVDDGTLDHAGVRLNSHGQIEHVRSLPTSELDYQKSWALTGACLLIRRADFKAVGCFDELYVNGCEDIDLCFKIRKSRRQLFVATNSRIRHHVSLSRALQTPQDVRNSQRLYGIWRAKLKYELAAIWSGLLRTTLDTGSEHLNGVLQINHLTKPHAAGLHIAEMVLQREVAHWKALGLTKTASPLETHRERQS